MINVTLTPIIMTPIIANYCQKRGLSRMFFEEPVQKYLDKAKAKQK